MEGMEVGYDPPRPERAEEDRGAGEVAQEVVIHLVCHGAYEAITAGVRKYRASWAGERSQVDVEEPEDVEESEEEEDS